MHINDINTHICKHNFKRKIISHTTKYMLNK